MINAITNNHYTGGNADLCLRAIHAFGFSSDKFATFKQWQQLNRSVVKGQKGLRLTKFVQKEVVTPSGQKIKKSVPVSFSVFNIEQTKTLN